MNALELQIPDVEQSAKTIVCRRCSRAPEPGEKITAYWGRWWCPACSEAIEIEQKETERREEQERIAAAAAARAAKWKEMCPPLYLATIRAKLPDQRAFDLVQAWEYGPQGLMLHGDSGCGKSRSLYALLHREHLAGRSVQVISSDAGHKYAEQFRSGSSSEWIQTRCRADILALDDAFKVKMTDSFEAALFTIVNYRTENCLPILATCQDTASTLLTRMSADRGPALIRRLGEFCDPIPFTKGGS